MKKTNKTLVSSIGALASVASIISPAAVVLADGVTPLQHAQTEVANAEKAKTFYMWNVAYGAVINLPTMDQQAPLLARLAAMESAVKTDDVVTVLKTMDQLVANKNLENYDKLVALLDKVSEKTNRDYLATEVSAWGHGMVYTSDVTTAVDAIVKAWGTKTPENIAAAKAATSNLKMESNKSYLNEQIAQIEGKMSVSVNALNATGTKKLEVKFNRAVDTTKAVIKVTKDGLAVNQSAAATFSVDNATAAINLVNKMTAGDYKVTVTGLSTDPISSTVTVKDEAINKISLNNSAILDRADASNKTVKISYTVYNQYNEDITETNPTLTFTVGRGNAIAANGILSVNDAGTVYAAGDKIAVSALDSNSGVFASTVATVGVKGQVSDIEISKIYNYIDDTKVLAADSNSSEYKLVMSFKDQYGNTMNTASDIANILADTVFTVSDTTKANLLGGAAAPTLVSEKINNVDVVTLKLNGPLTGGTSTIAAISKTTGKIAKFDIVVKESAKVDTLTVTAPEVAIAGEYIKIPVTAVDQFGKAMTTNTAITSGMTSALAATGGTTAQFKQDYVKGTSYIELDATSLSAAQTVIVTGITGTGKLVNFSVAVKAPNKATVIVGTDSTFVPNLAKTGVTNLKAELINVQDQYNREITPILGAGNYVYKVSTSDANIVSVSNGTSAYIKSDADIIALKGIAKGSANITVTLYKWADTNVNSSVDDSELTLVNGSAYTFSSKVADKADISSYELKDMSTLLAGTDLAHRVEVKVNGILADGTKVIVPEAGYYKVDISDSNVSYSNGNLVDDGNYGWKVDQTTRNVPVIVTVDGSSTTSVLTKNIIVTNVAPVITTLEIKDKGIAVPSAVKEAEGVVSVALAAGDSNAEVKTLAEDIVEAKDQYGVVIATTFASAYATNLPTGKTINTVAAGDSYNVTAVTANGKTIQFKVIVK